MFQVQVNSCSNLPSSTNAYVKVLTNDHVNTYFIGQTKTIDKQSEPHFDQFNQVPFIFHFARAESLTFEVYNHNTIRSDNIIGKYVILLRNVLFNNTMRAQLTSISDPTREMFINFTVIAPTQALPLSSYRPFPLCVQPSNSNLMMSRYIVTYLTFMPPLPLQLADSMQILYLRLLHPYGAYDVMSPQTTINVSPHATFAGPTGLTQIALLDTRIAQPSCEFGYSPKGEFVYIPIVYTMGQYQGTVGLNHILVPQFPNRKNKVPYFDCRSDTDLQYITVQELRLNVQAAGAYSSPQAIVCPSLKFQNMTPAYAPDVESCAKNAAQNFLSSKATALRRYIWTQQTPFTMQSCLQAHGRSMPSVITVELTHDDMSETADLDYRGYDANDSRCVVFKYAKTKKQTFSERNLDLKTPEKCDNVVFRSETVQFELAKVPMNVSKLEYICKGEKDSKKREPYVIVYGDDREIFSLKIPYSQMAMLNMTRNGLMWDMIVNLRSIP